MGGALPHRISKYGRSEIRCVTLYFEPELIRAHDSSGDDVQYLVPFLIQHSGFPHIVSAPSGVPSAVFSLMKRIYNELPADSTRSRLAVRTYLKMILMLLVNHYSEFQDSQPILTQRQRDLERLQPLFEFIEDHYMEEITVSEAACVVNMSKSHFMRYFKQSTGQPFVAHLNQFRVAKAQQLLVTTDRSIADIGQEVGFCNQSYFGLVFRRLTNLSPREYKLKLTAEAETTECARHPSWEKVSDIARKRRMIVTVKGWKLP
jgi:AraC-like DNA-binding protein